MEPMERIQDFLSQKRLAVAGVSRQPTDFSRSLFRELRSRGYDVVPVNPETHEVDGQPCFARVQDIDPPVTGALLMTPPRLTDAAVRDCAEAGVTRAWLYRGGGPGAVTADAVAFCESNGISVIPGECPFMFLPGGAWFHHLHALLRKVTGSYPK